MHCRHGIKLQCLERGGNGAVYSKGSCGIWLRFSAANPNGASVPELGFGNPKEYPIQR